MKKTIAFLLSVLMITAILCPAAVSNAQVGNFIDVSADAWYASAVEFVSSPQPGHFNERLFGGTSDTTFSPNMTMTRGMFVTVLGRLVGIDPDKYTGNLFLDVPDDMYYRGHIYWAYSRGIVKGTSSDTFSPEMNITREQMCAMLANFMKSIYNYEILDSKKLAVFDTFRDDALIHDWAKEQVYYMVSGQIVSGKGDLIFDPQGPATRAEVAKIFMNFCECAFAKTRFDETIIEIPGFTGEYKVLQISDAHLTLYNDSDDETMKSEMIRRSGDFASTDVLRGITSDKRLDYMFQFAEDTGCDRVILTGDTLDMPSQGNIAYLDSLLAKYNTIPYNFVLGNHDWCTTDHIMDNYAYSNFLPLLRHYYEEQNTEFETIEFDNFIFFMLNNSDLQVSRPVLNELLSLQEKNKPIFIFAHTPMNNTLLALLSLAHGWTKAVLMGQGETTDVTRQFISSVISEGTNVMGFFSGHVHFGADYKIGVNHDIYAATCDTAVSGSCRLITIRGTDA